MPEMELDEKALEEAVHTACPGPAPGVSCRYPSCSCWYAPQIAQAIRAYIRAAGLVSVPVIGGEG